LRALPGRGNGAIAVAGKPRLAAAAVPTTRYETGSRNLLDFCDILGVYHVGIVGELVIMGQHMTAPRQQSRSGMASYATDGAQETGVPGGEPDSEDTKERDDADAPGDTVLGDAAPEDVAPEDTAPGDVASGGSPLPGEDGPLPDEGGSFPDDEDFADGGDGDPGGGYPPIDDDLPAGRPKISKLAVFALVTGILSLVPVAVVTGIAALVGIRRSGRRGRGMAVTALFLAAAWLIVGGAVGTVGVLTHGFKKPVKTVYHEAAVFRLRPGECIDSPNGSSPTVVSCTVPHDAEVFGTFTLPGSAWPGTEAVQQEASAGCGTRLTSYLNPQLAISLAQTYVYPDQSDWKAGTKTVICEVRAASGQLSESVRGSSGS
jgi:putative regulator of septum formation